MAIDLHMHSTASDGTDAPEALGPKALEAGLSAIALTDHDTTAGLAACEAGCAEAGVRFVPGVELSVDRGKPVGTMHLLGYFVRPEAPQLEQITSELRQARTERNPRIIEKLNALGIDLTLDQVEHYAGDAVIGRPHIAHLLVERGDAASVQDAFRRYIGRGGAAYVRRDLLPPGRAIEAIHAAGGLAVLAHPVQLRCEDEDELEQTVRRLADHGLDGLEIWHSDHTAGLVEGYRRLAERLGLLATGGSDYHGRRKAVALGSEPVPEAVYDRLREAHARRTR